MNRKVLSILLLMGGGYFANAQVGIGTTSPNNSAQLEIVSADKGVLIPQVTLNSSTDSSTITNGNVNSLLVFNTASVSDVFPGYYYWLTDKWMRIISNKDIPANILTWDPAQNRFAYTDPAGNLQPVDLDRLLKNHETQTTIINNGGGNYTYTNEAGTHAIIHVAGDVRDNFGSIAGDPAVRNILSDIAKNTSGIVNYNPQTREFLYKDNSGAEQRADLDSIVKSYETQTTIINNGGGNYTYTNEAGTQAAIHVAGDVRDNFGSIAADPAVRELLSDIARNTSGIVNYNPQTREFLYKDNLGADQRADLDSIVKSHETQTTILNNGAGHYTYTNEAGTNAVINVIEDVKANASDIFSDPGVNAAVKSTTTNVLHSNGNIISSLVNGVNADTALINTIENRLQQNNLSTAVNGVNSNLLDLSSLKVEPWNLFGGSEKAVLNTDQIYTMGSWVGIGTNEKSSFADEALRVNGKIRTTSSVYADYVFQDYFQGYSDIKSDYKFRTLKEVEEFITTNKHLPGVTPITKLEKVKGGYSIDPTELSVQNLEKIEELYLHIIEQQKQLENKENQIKVLLNDAANFRARIELLEKKIVQK
ncbi:hypothetical protein [Flavobacterium sp. 22076]|uniref:hypothetical protein n=1 Tax=unclassified Flavobacterium TaxID=196869 RepID=UPI003F833DEC